MSLIPKPIRVFKEAQKEGSECLSPEYSIHLATPTDLTQADSLFETMKTYVDEDSYYRSYAAHVDKISTESYCDVKYLIKTREGSIVGYLGLETNKADTVISFVQIPLTVDYDPITTLLIKVWLFYHPNYSKIYYTMRHNINKVSPIDKYLKVIPLGIVNPHHEAAYAKRTFYYKTLKGGANDPFPEIPLG